MRFFLRTPLLALVGICLLVVKAATLDEVVDVDFDNTTDDVIIADKANYRSLTINVRGTRYETDNTSEPLKITVRNVTCARVDTAGDNSDNPCVTIIIKPEAKLGVLMVSINGVQGVGAVKIDLQGSVTKSNIALVWLSGCERSQTPCVEFQTGRNSSFTDSSFAVFSTSIKTFGFGKARASFVHYDINGFVAKANFNHNDLVNVQNHTKGSIHSGPVQVTGSVGLGAEETAWFFSGLRDVTYNLTGIVGPYSSFQVVDCTSSIAHDRAFSGIHFVDSTVILERNTYMYIDFGSKEAASDFTRTTVTFNDARVSNQSAFTEDRVIGIFFFGNLYDGSQMIVSNWAEFSNRGYSLYHSGVFGTNASITVENSTILNLKLDPQASDECSLLHPCTIAITNNSIYSIDLSGYLSAGTYVLIRNNSERKSNGFTTINRGLSGTGVVSFLSNKHVFYAYLNGFEGSIEFWNGRFGPSHKADNRVVFVSGPLPRRVLMNQIKEPVMLSGPMLESNVTHNAALASLYFGCADVYDSTAKDPKRKLPSHQPCTATAYMRRCDEGLATYIISPEIGYRNEYTMTKNAAPCTIAQNDPPVTTAPTAAPVPADDDDERQKKKILAGILVGVGVAFASAVVAFFIYRARRRSAEYQPLLDPTGHPSTEGQVQEPHVRE